MREFLPKGFHVFHDIQQDKAFVSNPFNYDHILLDHRGVFLIETIPRRKKNAIELSEELSNIIESNVPVYPLLVYPGWDVSRNSENPTAPLCDPRDISKEVEKKPEKALVEKAVSRIAKRFEALARNVDQGKV